ncbi:hypothetical protein H5407_20645 [Mitsuaria sp. WAJ17]|uniref:hypothetical protein n=1 Tax=Mitsuaria sp. WAJ17 TaxID=2761452 RepID=UPI0016038DED|nr:hypothetical protein [Mitsuaria sp. WAJ17]MBB2487652.1 hypothetical protein [Mitsuaria sp. WAJ17]
MRKTRPPADRPRRPGKASDLLDHGPMAPGSPPPAPQEADLALPHEREEATGTASTALAGRRTAGERQREVMRQAAADLAQGQVDTDLHASPGLDAQRRQELLDEAARPPARSPGGRRR